jgi:hypothetical protein
MSPAFSTAVEFNGAETSVRRATQSREPPEGVRTRTRSGQFRLGNLGVYGAVLARSVGRSI